PPSSSGSGMKEYAATPSARVGTLAPGFGVPLGQNAPDAVVQDTHGMFVPLADVYKKGAVLLAFYRGGWCPYCSYEIHELSVAFPEYQTRGVTPVAISVDK
ncbi:redoxin domain-containing protein, partial [Clostridioides difficile]|nr:redoxin domain-containing protein [Clostridioides difficile]